MDLVTDSMARWRKALGGVLAGFLLCPGLSARTEIAPYFQAWGGGSLLQARQTAGLDSAILAFGVTNGACSLDPRLLRRLREARGYVAAGGKLAISMGGADGTYAEIACTDSQLLALLEMLMGRSGSRHLDWDLEGSQLADQEGTARRGRVLAVLQARHPDLFTSFTLSGRLTGLSRESMRVLQSTIAAGARIDRVNVMTMSFGGKALATISPPSMSQASILSFRAAASQVHALFPGKTRAQLHAMMGMTPMIGANDDDTTFTLHDAQVVANFARDQGLGSISYWAFQRDRAQGSPGQFPLGSYSGVVQAAHQFHRIFRTAQGAPCTYPVWEAGKPYEAGQVVAHDGRLFGAMRANPGYGPTESHFFWAPYACPGASIGETPTSPANS